MSQGCGGVMVGLRRFDCASHALQWGAQSLYTSDMVPRVPSVSPVDAVLYSLTKWRNCVSFQTNRLFIKSLVMIWNDNRVRAMMVWRPCVLACWSSKTRSKLCLALSIMFVWCAQTLVMAVINSSLTLKYELERPGLWLLAAWVLSQNPSTGSRIPASRGRLSQVWETP